MIEKETFTFHEYGKKLGIGKWKRAKIGLIIATTYNQVFGELPPKKEVKFGSETILVNVYPIEFKQIVDNIVNSYNKGINSK